MKTKSLLVIIISLTANSLLSQDDPEKFIVKKSQYWNLSYSLGGVYDINHNTAQSKDYNNLGYNHNFDISYTPGGLVGFFANYSYGNVNIKDEAGNKLPQSVRFISLLLGARVYSNNKNLFADLGSGINGSGRGNKSGLAIAAGVGGKLKIIDGHNIIVRGSLHSSIFREKGNKSNLYFELSCGLEFNNSKSIYSETVKGKSRYSVGILIIKRNDFSNPVNFGIEASYNEENRIAMVLNYTHNLRSTNLFGTNFSVNRHLLSFSPRFYFGNRATKLFFESGANLSFSKDILVDFTTEELSSSKIKLFFGFNVGTGAEIGLLKNISAIVKTNVFVFFSGSDSFINYSGGLKYTF